jgi:uncharacterized protein
MVPLDDSQYTSLVELCLRYGIARLDVFGSVARGEDGIGSDVDLLYDLIPGHHIGWEITDAVDELAVIFGRPVDLVARRAVHPLLREQVESEARALYAA